jgi:hypothetical protein
VLSLGINKEIELLLQVWSKIYILWNNKAERILADGAATNIGFTGCNVWELTSIFREFIMEKYLLYAVEKCNLAKPRTVVRYLQKTETLYNEQK